MKDENVKLNFCLSEIVEITLLVETLSIGCDNTIFHHKNCRRMRDETVKCECNRDFFHDSVENLRILLMKHLAKPVNFDPSSVIGSMYKMSELLQDNGIEIDPELMRRVINLSILKEGFKAEKGDIK